MHFLIKNTKIDYPEGTQLQIRGTGRFLAHILGQNSATPLVPDSVAEWSTDLL